MADTRAQCGQLWEKFLNGDDPAFRQLYDLTYDDLYRYGHRLTNRPDDLRDLLQDTYLALWQRKELSREVRDPWLFLLVSLRNRIIDRARKVSPVALAVVTVPSPEDVITEAEQIAQRREWLRKKLATLPGRQREAIHLRYRVGLGYPEIAEVMGVAQQVAYNYVNRGIKAMRE